MKCFYHPGQDAVAICKSCNRGICPDCAVEVHPGLACQGRCEADVAVINQTIQRARTSHQNAGRPYFRNAIVLLIMGLIFTGIGILPFLINRDYDAFYMLPGGGIFLLWSWFSYRSGRQYIQRDDHNNHA